MRPNRHVVETLARAFVAGEFSSAAIVARSEYVLGRRWRWLPVLARRYVKAFSGRTRPTIREAVEVLRQDSVFQRACSKHSSKLVVTRWPIELHRMQPVAAAKDWKIPAIESVAGLAEWLGTDVDYLQWFADVKGLGAKDANSRLRHYHYRTLGKPSGEIRLIEAPKQATKKLQQRILSGILENVPVHYASHGFVKGRSIKTFTKTHANRRVVLRMDLKDFFPTFRAAKIQSFFRTLGYPEPVANLLAGVCTTSTPRDIWKQASELNDRVQIRESRDLYFRTHLPQGAPTSPALANLCSYRLDCRLTGLAKSAGAQYTRYADDLAFSGDEDFETRVERFSTHVAAMLKEEGFSVHHRKTRIMRQSVRQHLAGLVVNRRCNVQRRDFDRLKAILTNCVRLGPATQNRESHHDFRAHLEGKVSFVEMIHPQKGERLRRLLTKISWK